MKKLLRNILLSILIVLCPLTTYASDYTMPDPTAYTMQASVNTTPATDHIPDGYTYWFSYEYMGTYHVYYLKKLPNVFLVDYATMITIYPSSAIWEFASDEKGYNYHLYTDAWHYDATHTVTAKSTSQLKLYKNCLLMSNFSIKTKSGDYYWQFLRTDESLTKNYEVVTEGSYDGTNGDATTTDTEDNPGDNSLLTSILETITSIPEKIITFLSDILNNIVDMMKTIVNFVTNFFSDFLEFIKKLFIPSSEFLEEQKNKMMHYLEFYDAIKTLFNDLWEFMNATYDGIPPELNMDLSKIESKYYKASGTVNFLDLSWFEKYKPYSDNIISAFLLFFLFFNIFKNLPSIINGMSAIENDHQTREHRVAVQQKKEGGSKK